MEADEMRKEGIREWLLAGGGGFEGTPEASTFSFEGLIDYIDAFAVLAVRGALAREAGEPRNPSSEAGLRAEGLKVREQILEPSFCGVNGHFKFQQNGNSCLMCQRESRLILLASRIRTADDLQFCDKDEVETVRAALAKEARDAGPRDRPQPLTESVG